MKNLSPGGLSPGERPTSLFCATLFDGHKSRDNVRLVMTNGTITSIVDGAVPEPDDIGVGFVMPGLIDAHLHVTGYIEGLPAGAPFEPMKHFMRLCVANGVTTVRDTGNSLETLFYFREWGEKFDGPRIVGAGPLLDTPPFTWMFSRIVRDEQSARATVDRLVDEGVDFIKAYHNITPELLANIVDAARARGRYVAVDSQHTSALDALAIGVGSVEHAANLLDDAMLVHPPPPAEGMVAAAKRWACADLDSTYVKQLTEAFLAAESHLVPTLLVSRRWALLDEMVNEPHVDEMTPVMPYHRWFKGMRSPIGQRIGRRHMSKYMPVEGLSRRERTEVEHGLSQMAQLTVRLIDAGVRTAIGTDSPNPSIVPGFGLLDELVHLVESGVAPTVALRCATSSAAQLIPDKQVGTVAAGALADLCIVDGRPDRSIADIHRITRVIKGGKVLDLDTINQRIEEATRATMDRDG